MRVISGSARGRKLKEPRGDDIRPTGDLVKEAVFNIIQFDVEGRRVLDLFAGTGQLGIEALSRGAARAVFVDESRDALALVRENLQATGFSDGAEVVRGGALPYLDRRERFDVVFLDPPYDSPLIAQSLQKIIEFDILKENGIIVCEARVSMSLPELPPPFSAREYRYGKIKITVFRKDGL
ncbi:MAG: 16S rRNA (guanine(966)-N(2))-methyltransferase RsmD [Oscillospiraceae bacterium]|jgi:16S rRNA (guanine(966)-N(2))-methyltransferase RsmD|nr:16S rRNA (guanine(966)-N(2))-methyltransferase RsmD [Oscillospiraceae bacterium]